MFCCVISVYLIDLLGCAGAITAKPFVFSHILGLRNVGQIIVSQTKSAADFAQKHDLLGFTKAQENTFRAARQATLYAERR